MNKLSVLVFSLSFVVLSAFTTASAQDLKASWIEYQNSRNLLIESSVAIDEAWILLNSSWDNGPRASFQQWVDSWSIAQGSWAKIDFVRTLVANELNIILTDSEPRGVRGPNPPIDLPNRRSAVPSAPEPTWGSWEELNQAWASLDEAWATANGAWAELDRAWNDVALASDSVASYWARLDAEWVKINAAWADINAAWAGASIPSYPNP